MNKLISLFFLSAICLTSYAQDLAKPINRGFAGKNSLQVEVFGHGLLYSINYERVILNGPRLKTTGQAGIAYFPLRTDLRNIWIPISINQLVSFTHHHLEFGLGQVFVYDKEWEPFGSFRLGYRYQKPAGRLLFRAGFTPFIEYASALEYKERRLVAFYPSGGVAIGYSF